jgi:hypothetical protein
MVLTIKSYGFDAVGNTEMLFACTALLSVAALAGGTNAAQAPIASVIVKCGANILPRKCRMFRHHVQNG